MSILGVRTAPTQFRYAVVSNVDDELSLKNELSESLIKVPAAITEHSEQLNWQKSEIDRIIRQNPSIKRIVLKIGEYGRNDTKSSRLAAYFDAVVILSAKEAGIPIETKLYNQLGTKRASVKNDAEIRVGKTSKYWNEQIADAIVAAWSARELIGK